MQCRGNTVLGIATFWGNPGRICVVFKSCSQSVKMSGHRTTETLQSICAGRINLILKRKENMWNLLRVSGTPLLLPAFCGCGEPREERKCEAEKLLY